MKVKYFKHQLALVLIPCILAINLFFLIPELEAKLPAQEDPLVEVQTMIFDVVLEIRYATTDNFLKQAVYPSAKAYLKKSSLLKLKKAADILRTQGYRLKIYDAYRPLSVQKKMWDLVPDPRYVSDPKKGSVHNRGAAVDVSLVTLNGKAVEMPTDYDAFQPEAHHDYPTWTPEAKKNVQILKQAMDKAGFRAIPYEWWHYNDPAKLKDPLLDLSFEQLSN